MLFCSCLSVDELKLSSFHESVLTFNVDVLNSSELLLILSFTLIIAK